MKNLPDDYPLFYRTCNKCGHRFHSSDYACPKCIEDLETEYIKDILNKLFNPERDD